MKEIREKFDDLNIPREQFDDIVQIGAFNNNAPWEHVLAIAVSKISRVRSPHIHHRISLFLPRQDLTDTLIKICELLTSDPPGANARIPFEQWTKYYRYLAQVDGDISEEHLKKVLNYLQNEWVLRQNGMIHPRNFLHPECPKIDG